MFLSLRKPIVRLVVTCGAIFCLFLPTPAGAVQQNNDSVVVILDASNSMWGRIDGKAKINVAQGVLSDVLSDLPEDISLGLAVYGHRSKKDCDDIEMVLPVGTQVQNKFKQVVGAVKPKGMTPITGALKFVANEVKKQDSPAHFVLVSDGKETCEGDPCDAVKAIRKSGSSVKVHVVGFDVTDEESKQLRCIADAGGGSYSSAKSTKELSEALGQIKQDVVAEASRSKPAPGKRLKAHWRLETDGAVHEGHKFRFAKLNGNDVLQMFNGKGINLAIAVPGDWKGQKSIAYAMFVEGRGAVCERVGSSDAFTLAFSDTENGWASAAFKGTLACPGFRGMKVSGTFQVKR